MPAADPDPLLPLTLQLLFVQIVAFPAILLVWDATPHYAPVAFAALLVGASFVRSHADATWIASGRASQQEPAADTARRG